MANELWQQRVQRAQMAAAARRGVDVSIMLPPRNPSADGSTHQAEKTVVEAVAADVVAEAVAVVEAVAPVAEAAPAPAAAGSEAADRVAAAKARAAAKTSSVEKTAAPATPAPKPTAPRPTPAKTAPVAEAPAEVGQAGMNRREFITYAWAAALGLVTLEGGLATYLFMYPRFRAGEFGGKFELGPASALPEIGASPKPDANGKFWLVNTEEGPKALYMVCTHLGCLYKWEPSNNRFECPCHGSKFSLEGDYIEGPAPRSLDHFIIELVDNGTVLSRTEDAGNAVQPPSVSAPNNLIVVDTGKRITGKSAAESPARVGA